MSEQQGHAETPALLLQPVHVHTGRGDEEGRLVLADGRLVAVLVYLADEIHAELVGSWFLETGYGPCATARPPIFENLDVAQQWVKCQFGPARKLT